MESLNLIDGGDELLGIEEAEKPEVIAEEEEKLENSLL